MIELSWENYTFLIAICGFLSGFVFAFLVINIFSNY